MGRVCGVLLHGCSGTSATRIDLRSRRWRSVWLYRIAVYALRWRLGESVWLRARCRQTIEHRRSAGRGPIRGVHGPLSLLVYTRLLSISTCALRAGRSWLSDSRSS